MGLWFGCGIKTKAGKRFERHVMVTMSIYMAVLFLSIWVVKHHHPQGWQLYTWALLPAVPVIAMLAGMGRYLGEETDEFQRALVVRSLLVGTAALVGTLVVNDFLRAVAGRGDMPPFTGYVIFFVGFGITQGVQQMTNKVSSDD